MPIWQGWKLNHLVYPFGFSFIPPFSTTPSLQDKVSRVLAPFGVKGGYAFEGVQGW